MSFSGGGLDLPICGVGGLDKRAVGMSRSSRRLMPLALGREKAILEADLGISPTLVGFNHAENINSRKVIIFSVFRINLEFLLEYDEAIQVV